MAEIKLSALKNLTLLLVEDDDDLTKQFEAILKLFFAQVFIAKDGKEALDIYEKNRIDMIITDYVMPIMDGYEFCRTVRLGNKNIPIVIMSSYTDKDKLLNAIKLGLVDYLVKPFDYNELIAVLNSMIIKMEDTHISSYRLSESLQYSSSSKELHDTVNNVKIKLSRSEIELLELFVHNQGQVITYEMIEYTLWPNDTRGNESIKNIIYRFRKKLGINLFVNIQDMGYLLKYLP